MSWITKPNLVKFRRMVFIAVFLILIFIGLSGKLTVQTGFSTVTKRSLQNVDDISELTRQVQHVTAIDVSLNIDNRTRNRKAIVDLSTPKSKHNRIHKESPASPNSKRFLDIKKRFEDRMALVRDVCKRSNYSAIPSKQIWDKLAFDRLTFCSIPKSGTTYLAKHLGPTIKKLDESDGDSFPEEEHKRFYLVREPYSRLVSAFFSKCIGHPYWWHMNGRYIVHIFRPNASEESVRCGHDVTFPEYIKFVIRMHENRSGDFRNEHFLRMMEICNVCVDPPDFLGKLETIQDDMDYILHSVNMTGNTHGGFIEVKHLAELFMVTKNIYVKANCGSMCRILKRFWWGQQATGLIALDIDLPVKGDQCENMTGKALAELAWDAYQKSLGRIDKREQKRKVIVELFRQVPIEDKEKIQELLSIECELFGYESRPDFVFS